MYKSSWGVGGLVSVSQGSDVLVIAALWNTTGIQNISSTPTECVLRTLTPGEPTWTTADTAQST